jgi:dephospho-CoA kinase
MESAILLEKPLVRGCADKVLTVTAPLDLRIERVMARDKVERERVLERMAAQWSDEKRSSMADFIIFADGKRALLPQVRGVYDAMCAL